MFPFSSGVGFKKPVSEWRKLQITKGPILKCKMLQSMGTVLHQSSCDGFIPRICDQLTLNRIINPRLSGSVLFISHMFTMWYLWLVEKNKVKGQLQQSFISAEQKKGVVMTRGQSEEVGGGGAGGLTCVTCSSTWMPRGLICTRGNTHVSSSPPSLIPSSSESSHRLRSPCLVRAVFTTSMMRSLATAEKSCLLPGCRGDTREQNKLTRWQEISGSSGGRSNCSLGHSALWVLGKWVCAQPEYVQTRVHVLTRGRRNH